MVDGENGAAPVEGADKGGRADPVLGGKAAEANGGAEPVKLDPLTGENWRLHLAGGDADIAKRFDRFTDPGALGKSVIEMEKRWSDPRTARLPAALKEGATDEEKAAHAKETRDFYTKIGVPEAADKYDIKVPDNAPETVKQGVELIKAVGVDLGLTNQAASGLAAKLAEWQTQTDEAFEASAIETENKYSEALKSDWGGDYETNRNLAKAAGTHFFGETFGELMNAQMADGTRLGTNPAIIKALASVGREFQGDPMFSRIASGGADPATIQTQIDALNALRDGTRAGNAAYDAKREDLLKLIDLKRKFAATA